MFDPKTSGNYDPDSYHKNPHTLPLPLVLFPIKCALILTSMTMTAVREFYHFPLLSIKCAMAVTASHEVQYNGLDDFR